jgi:hypothetical protein
VLASLAKKQRARKGEPIGQADTWEACEPMLAEAEA